MTPTAKAVPAADGAAPDSSELVRNQLHELQNYLHLATMEVELAQMDAQEKIDCVKMLEILNAFKQSLQRLRDQLSSSNHLKGPTQ
jgi:hypothetical protein